MASALIDIASPSEAITSIPNLTTMAIKKSKALHFCLPLNIIRPKKNRLKQQTKTMKVDEHQVLPETSSEHSEDHCRRHHHTMSSSGSATASGSTITSASSSSHCSSLGSSSALSALESLLSADVQLQVFSFLDLPSLRNVMATNRAIRGLLVSDAAYQVWHQICQSKFSCIFMMQSSSSSSYDSKHGMFLQDECSLPIAAVSPNHAAFCRYNRVNLPLLLSMTPDHVPTGIMMMDGEEESNSSGIPNIEDDATINSPPPLIQVLSDDEEDSETDASGAHHADLNTSINSSSSSSSSSSDIRLHFHGNVGSGQEYSVKANHPLPRPTLQQQVSSSSSNSKMSLRKKLKSRRSSSSSKKVSAWNPMVVPYTSLADAPRLIHITPRLVSYFEISVQAAAPTPEIRRPVRFGEELEEEQEGGPQVQDCVVIGLATKAFSSRGNSLPGWDLTSFGYHSDNGGLYHGSGHARQRTESFGPGDTVGMGVDFVSRTIFVTKNGRFLGSAYDVFTMDFLATQDLYPVVGMDSKDTVHVNYDGCHHPFHFNLASYCHRQQQNMVPAKSRISTKFQFTQDPNGVEVGC